jgi:hypothetical protein
MIKLNLRFLFLVVLVSSTVLAQNSKPETWQRFQSDNGEFSIEMPGTPAYFFDRDGFIISPRGKSDRIYAEMRLLNSSSSKTVMSVEIYRPDNVKACLKEIIERDGLKENKTKENLPGFETVSLEKRNITNSSTDENIEISHTSKYIISKTHLYIVSVSNRGPQSEEAKRFLSSLKLTSGQTGADLKDAVKISGLTAIGLPQIIKSAGDVPPPAQTGGAVPPNLVKNPGAILVVTKPSPTYTDNDRRDVITGAMRVRIGFAESGRISSITIVTALSKSLSRNAVFAALRLKFIPEEKDGVDRAIEDRGI